LVSVWAGCRRMWTLFLGLGMSNCHRAEWQAVNIVRPGGWMKQGFIQSYHIRMLMASRRCLRGPRRSSRLYLYSRYLYSLGLLNDAKCWATMEKTSPIRQISAHSFHCPGCRSPARTAQYPGHALQSVPHQLPSEFTFVLLNLAHLSSDRKESCVYKCTL